MISIFKRTITNQVSRPESPPTATRIRSNDILEIPLSQPPRFIIPITASSSRASIRYNIIPRPLIPFFPYGQNSQDDNITNTAYRKLDIIRRTHRTKARRYKPHSHTPSLETLVIIEYDLEIRVYRFAEKEYFRITEQCCIEDTEAGRLSLLYSRDIRSRSPSPYSESNRSVVLSPFPDVFPNEYIGIITDGAVLSDID